MTLLGSGALLGTILEDGDLLTLAVANDLSLDLSALDCGGTKLAVLAIDDCQNLIEYHGLTSLGVQLLNEDDVAFFHAVERRCLGIRG